MPSSHADTYLGYVGEPLEQCADAVKVLAADVVRDAVFVHDLHPAQLVVGGVHLAPQQLCRADVESA